MTAVRAAGEPATLRRPTPRTIAERIREARRRSFVGRLAQQELFRAALDEAEPSFAVLFIHGPGGIGKTSLLERLADLAGELGVGVTRLDLSATEPTPQSLLRELAAGFGLGDSAGVAEALASQGRHVILLDTYETAAPLDPWLRQQLLPRLTASTIVVIAGRTPPAPEWLTDPGWRKLVRVVALRNLPPADARIFLSQAGVDHKLHERAIELTHGHPLALSLISELIGAEGSQIQSLADLREQPNLVRRLLESYLDRVPSVRHRHALHVCAHARFTTEALLREVLAGDDANELFGWLRSLPFVEEWARGLVPHDLARDALDADLRWRDPPMYQELHQRMHRYLFRRTREVDGPERHFAVADAVFLNRGNPFAASFWQWRTFGNVYADSFRTEDRDALLAMTTRHEGPESAALVEHWLGRQPAGFRVLRSGADPQPVGFGAIINLHEASSADIAADPGCTAMWQYATTEGAVRPGDRVFASRFYMDRDHYQSPCASYNAITVAHTEEMLRRDSSSLEFIGLFAEPERIQPLMSYIDYQRIPSADFNVGARRYGVFVHDWRRVGLEPWLGLMSQREAAAGFDPALAMPSESPIVALSHEEFSAAVRSALRDFHRPAILAANPLLESELVRNLGGDRLDALRQLLEDEVDTLAADPRDAKLERALRQTYLRPAQSQELAAEALDLPFSTYKRHLRLGIERLTASLWQREIHGPSARQPRL